MARDPAGYDGGIGLYCYCGNDPTNRVDAYGTDSTRSVEIKAVWTPTNGECGGPTQSGAAWQFKATSPQHGEEGYIVQKVYVRCHIKPCRDCPEADHTEFDHSYFYFEAWPAKAGLAR